MTGLPYNHYTLVLVLQHNKHNSCLPEISLPYDGGTVRVFEGKLARSVLTAAVKHGN